VLGVVVVLLLVLLSSPLNRYFGSRSDLADARAQLQHDRAKLSQLETQYRLWSDPGYIQQQARTRLQYAMPGDTVYVVVDKGQRSGIEKTTVQAEKDDAGSWNTRLWSTVQQAGR
jgi:cell division protein FtsB